MSEQKKIRVLITGGAGFIGSHVARHCLDLGMDVVVLDDLSGGFLDHVPAGVEVHTGSVTNNGHVEILFQKYKFDYVYHMAAYAAEGLSHYIRHFNYETNLLGSINIINACVRHEVKCLVFTSSIAVMAGGNAPYDETDLVMPEDPYAISKAAVECDLRAALNQFGLNYIIFRPFNVYGENQNIGDKYRNVIGIFMNQIMSGQPLTVFGDGEQKRAFSYIDDVAPHIAASATRHELYNHTFFIGGDTPYTINELIDVVSREFGVAPEIKYLQARNETREAWAVTAKARNAFGIKPTMLEVGIHRMAAWARRVGARKSKEFENIEIRKSLPEGW